MWDILTLGAHAQRGFTVVVLCVCVCVCVQAAHLRLTQLSDKLDILTDLVSCWLQHEFGVFRIMASFRSYDSRPFLYAKRAHFLPYTTLVISRVR